MCGEARTKPAGKMRRVNVSKQRPLGLRDFCLRGIRKRFGFVANTLTDRNWEIERGRQGIR